MKSTNLSKPKTHLGFCSGRIGSRFCWSCWDWIRTMRKVLLELIGSDRISGSLSLCLVPYLSFPTEAHLGFARVGSDLGFTGVEFCLNKKIESNRLELYVEINFIVLNLEQWNQVYCTRDVSFLNIFENVLTNKIV